MKQLYKPGKEKMKVAVFMSGSGSVARKIIEKQSKYTVELLFTDNEKSNAKQIAQEHGIAYYCNDIKKFYEERNAGRKDMSVRKEYDLQTAKILEKHGIETVALAGYMSIVTEEIHGKFLTINIHPADLRLLEGKKRRYAGCMGEECIARVIADRGPEVRSTMHLVNGEVDGGSILMVSEPVRITNEPAGKIHERLKEAGDFKIYPKTLKKLASGDFYHDEESKTAIDIAEEKQILREGMRRIREQMSEEEIIAKSRQIATRVIQNERYQKAGNIMLYMATKNEAATIEIIKNSMDTGKKVILPITRRTIIPVEIKSLEGLREGKFGIIEPSEERKVDPAKLELVIVPGITFDEKGNRIGYGLGYYDKFLKKTNAFKIGLCFESQIVDRAWATEDDVPMDMIITENRTIGVGA